jgi:hypothetical protein
MYIRIYYICAFTLMYTQVLGVRDILPTNVNSDTGEGTSDPFITCSYGGYELGETRVRANTLHANWSNETFIIPINNITELKKIEKNIFEQSDLYFSKKNSKNSEKNSTRYTVTSGLKMKNLLQNNEKNNEVKKFIKNEVEKNLENGNIPPLSLPLEPSAGGTPGFLPQGFTPFANISPMTYQGMSPPVYAP